MATMFHTYGIYFPSGKEEATRTIYVLIPPLLTPEANPFFPKQQGNSEL